MFAKLFTLIYVKFVVILIIFSFFSCSNSQEIKADDATDILPNIIGKGVFLYDKYAPLAQKPVKVYFNIPDNVNAQTPLVFVFHGVERNAEDYRDALVAKSNQHQFILVVPEFSETFYPSANQYNLGNVFVNGENPSLTTLNPESIWTFSIIEPLFDYIISSLQNASTHYHIIGHSAGAQFTHRLLMYKPNGRYQKVVSSAAGWYTVPNTSENFPYGFKESPLMSLSLPALLEKKVIVQVGSLDNNPNASGLRRNSIVDIQGTHRLARAQYFFNFTQDLALTHQVDFQWELQILQGFNHNFAPAIQRATDLIFN
jgi:hypothetical protein